MSKSIFYKQCLLERQNEGSSSRQVAWIAENFATVGLVLKIKNKDNSWEDGWVVKNSSSERIEEGNLPDSHACIKAHRKKTGDALKK